MTSIDYAARVRAFANDVLAHELALIRTGEGARRVPLDRCYLLQEEYERRIGFVPQTADAVAAELIARMSAAAHP